MIARVLSWLSSGAIKTIGAQITQAYKAKLSAQNDQARIDAEQQIAVLEAQQMVLISEQRNIMTRWIRPAFALPFIIYNFKIIVWDKVFGFGVTDALSPHYWQLQMIVFGAYFLTRPLERTLERRFGRN